MEKKKMVFKLDLEDDKAKQKAMKTVSSLSGIESIAIQMKEKKLTVIGEVDPIEVVSKLRKLWRTDILTVGPAKEPEKKKDETKNEEGKKDAEKKDEDKKKFEERQIAELMRYYRNYYIPYMYQNQYYYPQSAEENPNSCVIS